MTVSRPRSGVHAFRGARDADLWGALDEDRFVVHYQPIVRLAGTPIDCPPPAAGVEALLRYYHKFDGVLLPSAFLPALEGSPELMCEVGSQVLSMAATRAAEARLDVSVNVSPVQLFHGDLVATVARVLERSSLPPASLTLEMTWQLAVDDLTRAAKVLRRLSAIGVQIVADDFGSGCFSLAWLCQLPLDGIKLDRTFLAHLPGSPAARTTVADVIALVHDLGLFVTAEGVESDVEARAVRELSFDYAQGYFYGLPVPRLPHAPSEGRAFSVDSTLREAPLEHNYPRAVALTREPVDDTGRSGSSHGI